MKAKYLLALALIPVALAFSGCGEHEPIVAEFEPNLVFAYQIERQVEQSMAQALDETEAALTDLFGTPDEPRIPEFILEDDEFASLISQDKLDQASGPANEQGRGLYRKHCATCHGITGNGRGTAAALLDPYPRDYRLGRFKFKNTPVGRKPTKEDLAYTIEHGIPGTTMVPIKELTDSDIAALVDYVIYLSWRGEVERNLLMEAEYVQFEVDEEGEGGESLYQPALKDSDPETWEDQWELIQDFTIETAERWVDGFDSAVEPPAPDPEMVPETIADLHEALAAEGDSPVKQSVERGKQIFVSEQAACAKCHGPTGLGDGQANDYDDWTKDWTKRFGLDPTDEAAHIPLIARGALPARKAIPRNFQEGLFRGGSQPQHLYQRIALGIEGTPMPAASLQEEQIWDLVNYVRSLAELPAELPLTEEDIANNQEGVAQKTVAEEAGGVAAD